MTISKIIHQIWTQGSEHIPKKYINYVDGWKAYEKEGYHYICWDDNTLKELIKRQDASLLPVYEYFDMPQQRSDLGRYLVLYYYGGFYIDMDIEPGSVSLNHLLEYDMATSQGGYSGVRQSFMASKPTHSLFKELIEHIRISYPKKWYDVLNVLYVQRTTGGETYKRIISSYDNIYRIPNSLVYYCDSIDDCEMMPSCIAMMHFEPSWNGLLYLQRFMVYYKYIMGITLAFLVYIILGKCNSRGVEMICSIRNVLRGLCIVTFLYLLLSLAMNGVWCRTGVVYFVLLFVSFVSLREKCNICTAI